MYHISNATKLDSRRLDYLYVHLVLFFDFFSVLCAETLCWVCACVCVYQNRLLNGTFFTMVFVPYVLCNIQLDSSTLKRIWIQCQAVINNVYYLSISKGINNSPLPFIRCQKNCHRPRSHAARLHEFYLFGELESKLA